MAIELTCGCGRVVIEVARPPEFLHECNCSVCSRSKAWWGYYHPDEVRISGETTGRRRHDKAEPVAEFRSCRECGEVTHFVLTEAAQARHGKVVLGVNLRLAAGTDLAGVELRYPDGAAWSGEGPFAYVREARVLD